jgi:hypothetical protein
MMVRRRLQGTEMKIAIQFSSREECKALPVLLRHSPGMILKNGVYVVSLEAAQALRQAGIKFTEVTSELNAPSLQEAELRERV